MMDQNKLELITEKINFEKISVEKMNLKQPDYQTEIKGFLVRRKLCKVCYTVR